MAKLPEFPLKIIGTVKNEMKEPGGRQGIQQIVSEVVLDESLSGSLGSITEYTDVTILYWAHIDRHPGEKPNKIHPHNQESNPAVGIFATRSSDRPNRILMCSAKILEAKAHILKVAGLDAIDGSPVIDIKPYNARHDSRPDAKMPPWS